MLDAASTRRQFLAQAAAGLTVAPAAAQKPPLIIDTAQVERAHSTMKRALK